MMRRRRNNAKPNPGASTPSKNTAVKHCPIIVVVLIALAAPALSPASVDASPLGFTDETFTVAVIPDTQIFSVFESWTDANFVPMTQWVRDNQAAENIVFTTHVGDVTQGELTGFGALDDLIASHPQQFANAERAMGIIGTPDTAIMPYSVTIGNHDYAVTGDKSSSTADFRQYYGPQRYAGFDWYGGSYSVTGDTDRSGINHYQFFEGGGVEFLHLNIEHTPTSDVLDWAESVIAAHPNNPVILSTHNYLNDPDEDSNGAGRTGAGEKIWQELVRSNPQVFMVLAGHEHNGEDGDDGEYRQTSVNDAGLEVFESLSNYQDYFTQGLLPDLADGGEGWMRLMEFDLIDGTIDVETFFPAEDRFQTDADSRFSLTADFEQRFFFIPEPGTAMLLSVATAAALLRRHGT